MKRIWDSLHLQGILDSKERQSKHLEDVSHRSLFLCSRLPRDTKTFQVPCSDMNSNCRKTAAERGREIKESKDVVSK